MNPSELIEGGEGFILCTAAICELYPTNGSVQYQILGLSSGTLIETFGHIVTNT